MRTKEFIKRIEELGFRVREEKANIDIIADNFIIAEVSKNRLYCINTYNSVKVEWTNEKELFDLIVEYAKTPIEDRKEEKYYLVKFSEKEIEEIKKKFDTELADFELVEVEE